MVIAFFILLAARDVIFRCLHLDGQNVVMQFGRINENEFALDYRSPLTAIQAFAIALTSFQSQ